jgi:hypothetical protein
VRVAGAFSTRKIRRRKLRVHDDVVVGLG